MWFNLHGFVFFCCVFFSIWGTYVFIHIFVGINYAMPDDSQAKKQKKKVKNQRHAYIHMYVHIHANSCANLHLYKLFVYAAVYLIYANGKLLAMCAIVVAAALVLLLIILFGCNISHNVASHHTWFRLGCLCSFHCSKLSNTRANGRYYSWQLKPSFSEPS